jgi:hypothetical protein
MAGKNRPTMRELAEVKNVEKRKAMQAAIDDGRLKVRQMTPRERKESDARRAAFAEARPARPRKGSR